MQINEALVAALRVVPRLPAGAVLPELMPHRAHLHAHRFLHPLLDFDHEFVRPIPALVAAAQDRTAVNRVEIHTVEVAAVHDLGVIRRDLLKEGRFRIGNEQAEAFLQVTGFRALIMHGGFAAERSALHAGEFPGCLLAESTERHQLVAEVQHDAVVLEETRDRAQAGGGFAHGDFGRVRAERFRECERAERIETRIRYGRHILRPLINEEGIRVKDRADTRLVKPGDDPPPRIPAVRPFLPVQFHVAKAEERPTAVIVNLREAETARHLAPILDVGLGERSEVEQIRAVVERHVARPRPGDFADRQFARLAQRFLKCWEHPAHGCGDDGHFGADEPEFLFARCAESALQRRQGVHSRGQVERQRARAEWFVWRALQRERNVEKCERINLRPRDGFDGEDDARRTRFGLEHDVDVAVTEAQSQTAIRQFCRSAGAVLASDAGQCARRRHVRAEIVSS